MPRGLPLSLPDAPAGNSCSPDCPGHHPWTPTSHARSGWAREGGTDLLGGEGDTERWGKTDPAWLLHEMTFGQFLRVHVQTHTDTDIYTSLSFHLHIYKHELLRGPSSDATSSRKTSLPAWFRNLVSAPITLTLPLPRVCSPWVVSSICLSAFATEDRGLSNISLRPDFSGEPQHRPCHHAANSLESEADINPISTVRQG